MYTGYVPPNLVRALIEIGELQEFARKIKDPPQVLQKEKRLKEERPPLQETSRSSYDECRLKYKNLKEVSQTPESEIIRFLYKQSSLSFTVGKILSMAEDFGVSEYHLRTLISTVTKLKYGI
ncbi:MAG: hypothetical protein EOO85_28825 [Pedobacter sp.]|nr:MAG: hypothetical protein EOO85_28825 [Pedobacter sp.]